MKDKKLSGEALWNNHDSDPIKDLQLAFDNLIGRDYRQDRLDAHTFFIACGPCGPSDMKNREWVETALKSPGPWIYKLVCPLCNEEYYCQDK